MPNIHVLNPSLALDERYVNARRHLLIGAAQQVFAALEEASVDAMLLKGEATADALYPPAELRFISDVDVLVRMADLPRARALLRSLGYQPLMAGVRAHEVAPHAETWRRGSGAASVEIDLHTSFHGVNVDSEGLWECWWPKARGLLLGEQRVAAPGLASSLLIVALHRNRSADATAAVRDLELAMRQRIEVWSLAAAQARVLQCETTMAAGLLRHPAGADLLRRLGIDATVTRREAFFQQRARGQSSLGLGWYDWAQLQGRRARIRRLSEELWLSPTALRLYYPYAERNRNWAALARSQRMVDLLRRSPRGLLQAFGPHLCKAGHPNRRQLGKGMKRWP